MNRRPPLDFGLPAEEKFEALMAQLTMIGVHPEELHWLRLLTALLRHPDPGVPELARQALLYLTEAAVKRESVRAGTLDHAG